MNFRAEPVQLVCFLALEPEPVDSIKKDFVKEASGSNL